MSTRKKKASVAAWQARFLEALAESGVVRVACLAAEIDYSLAYRARREDAAFAEAWEDALDEAADLLEEEAWRRARGVERKVHVRKGTDENGRAVYEEQTLVETDTTLLIFLLKAARPAKYRDNYDAKAILAAVTAALAAGNQPRAAEDPAGVGGGQPKRKPRRGRPEAGPGGAGGPDPPDAAPGPALPAD